MHAPPRECRPRRWPPPPRPPPPVPCTAESSSGRRAPTRGPGGGADPGGKTKDRAPLGTCMGGGQRGRGGEVGGGKPLTPVDATGSSARRSGRGGGADGRRGGRHHRRRTGWTGGGRGWRGRLLARHHPPSGMAAEGAIRRSGWPAVDVQQRAGRGEMGEGERAGPAGRTRKGWKAGVWRVGVEDGGGGVWLEGHRRGGHTAASGCTLCLAALRGGGAAHLAVPPGTCSTWRAPPPCPVPPTMQAAASGGGGWRRTARTSRESGGHGGALAARSAAGEGGCCGFSVGAVLLVVWRGREGGGREPMAA